MSRTKKRCIIEASKRECYVDKLYYNTVINKNKFLSVKRVLANVLAM